MPSCAAISEQPPSTVPAHVVCVIGDEAMAGTMATTIERAALAALQQEGLAAPVELSIALVSPQEIRELNRTYRQVDDETDVLSFSMDEGQELPSIPGVRHYLGDIAISVRRAQTQAQEYGHSVEREFAYLTVHGVLHLLGHDHHEPGEQRCMREAEEAALTHLGLERDPT